VNRLTSPRPGDNLDTMASPLRLLFVQSRTDRMRVHEYECLRRRTAGHAPKWQIASIFDPEFGPDLLDDCDSVIFGGTGEVKIDHPRLTHILPCARALVRAAAENGVPFLGVSFGHQIVANAFGGSVVQNPKYSELGLGRITLTEAGQADPLFEGSPASFDAIVGHNDSVEAVPPELELLATGERCPNQVFHLPGSVFYTTQFHPELDEDDLRVRVEHYRAQYARPGSEPPDASELGPTPDANRLVARFLELAAARVSAAT